jgi:hypothetical protein
MGTAVGDTRKTVNDVNKGFDQARAGASVVAERFKGVSGALSFGSDSTSQALMALQTQANKNKAQGIANETDAEKQRNKITEEQKKRTQSEAATAADTQLAMQKMANEILEGIMPIFKLLQPMLLGLAQGLAGFVHLLSKIPGGLTTLGYAVAALTALYIAHKTIMAVSAVKSSGSKVLDMMSGGPKELVGPPKPGGPLGAITGGAGEKTGGVLQGLATGLKAFGSAAPQILLGAAALAGAIAIIGAGIAAASWIMGKALPTLAEGFKSFNDINGGNLVKVGAGIGALGLGLVAFGAGSGAAAIGGVIEGLTSGLGKLFGAKSPIEKIKEYAALGPGLSQAGNGIRTFNTSLAQLMTTDTARIYKVADALVKLKGSIPQESLTTRAANMMTGLVDKFSSQATATKVPLTKEQQMAEANGLTKVSETATAASAMPEINFATEIRRLNTISTEMLRVMKDTAEQAKLNVNATKSLNRNLFPV